ncbi:MAG TPA: tail fiber domain-containing protein, partial [Thermoanaerobaculia bacterium]|nr:tail fiber domain-containing protein [Thermoanaerobaculia bacterium]
MRLLNRISVSLVAAAVAALIPLGALADMEQRAARLVTTTRAIEWQPTAGAADSMLSVKTPDGQVRTQTFAAGQNPMLRLDGLADGLYSYELRVMQADAKPLSQSGSFTIANGAVLPPTVMERKIPHATPMTFFSDFVSAAGGVCGGSDCTSTESMGTATIKLKANNVRLKFEDTSTLSGFPGTDWQLSANDTFSGGANKFFVEDLTAATVPFTIEGGTPNNTLWVDSTARVGINTSTPARDLTVDDPVSSIIRMEQSASPFQAWDVVANNNNFIVRDVSHETDPFIVRTSAPYYSLVVDTTGRIGLGVSAPLYQIHHSSGARLDAGSWINASSRTVKQDIQDLDGNAAFDAFKALQPVTFAYKAAPAQTRVGFIAEDVPALVATPDRKGLSSMDIVAVLTKVVQEQQRTIDEMQARLQKLE